MSRVLATFMLALLLAGCTTDEADRVVGETASDRIEITAESGEPIVSIAVREGERVVAGQALVVQDPARARTKIDEAEAAVGKLEARLDELKRGPRSEKIEQARASLAGAERELEFRRAELERVVEIHERELASPDALDRAQAAFDAASTSAALRRAELEEHLAGTTIEELRQAEHALGEAEARLAAARIDLERHTLRAPVDARADTRLFEIGERPGAGQPVLILLSGGQAYARVYVPERLRAEVGPGTPATVHVDGLEAPLTGRVRWVASEAAFTPYFALTERDRGNLSYLAKVDIVDATERLPDGVPVEVRFTPAATP